MRPRLHGQGSCPEPTERLIVVGDQHRVIHALCAECRAIYEGAPFVFTFVPASMPEWQRRATERRLPAKVNAA